MRLEGPGIGVHGTAVKSGGIVQTILRVGHVAGVEQSAGVFGMSCQPGVQFCFGGLPVGAGDGSFSGDDLIGAARLLGREAAVEAFDLCEVDATADVAGTTVRLMAAVFTALCAGVAVRRRTAAAP